MKAALLRYLPLLLLALAWEVGARTGLVSTLALPPLSTVAAAWIELLKDGELITNGAASLWRAGAGLFLSMLRAELVENRRAIPASNDGKTLVANRIEPERPSKSKSMSSWPGRQSTTVALLVRRTNLL